MAKVIGIDLGTTNSAMAVIEAGEPTVLENAEGNRMTPSVVAVNPKTGERLVGDARQAAGDHQPREHGLLDQALHGPQVRRPGRPGGDQARPVQGRRAPRTATSGWSMGGKEYSPPEISAMILQKLKADAEAKLGDKVTQAVITVPAYFNDAQRQATKDAGQIAGLEVLRIVNEPTAAVARLRPRQGRARRRSSPSTTSAAARSTSRSCASARASSRCSPPTATPSSAATTSTARSSTGSSPSSRRNRASTCARTGWRSSASRRPPRRPRSSCRRRSTTEINLPFITADAAGPEPPAADADPRQARAADRATRRADRAARSPKALEDAKLEAGRHRRGRAGRRPDAHAGRAGAGQEAVQRQGAAQGRQPRRGRRDRRGDPGRRARGRRQGRPAARRDAALARRRDAGRRDDRRSSRATPRSRPRKSEIFSTAADNQTQVEIHVLQGERPMASENKSLGRFILDGIPPAPRGMPQIEVTFDIDANGILNVSAKDKATGKEQRIVIQPIERPLRGRDRADGPRGRGARGRGRPAPRGGRAHATGPTTWPTRPRRCSASPATSCRAS